MPSLRFKVLLALVVVTTSSFSCRSASNLMGEANLIRTTERQRLQALVDGDLEQARQLHADDFQLINPVGASSTKEEYLGAIASGEIDYLRWEPGEFEVRVYGEGAIIRYRSQLQIVIGGRDMGMRPHWHTDSYEKRDGRWQVVWSQATTITSL